MFHEQNGWLKLNHYFLNLNQQASDFRQEVYENIFSMLTTIYRTDTFPYIIELS